LLLYIGVYPTGGITINGYIDDLRITKGYARYTSSFNAPTAPFPLVRTTMLYSKNGSIPKPQTDGTEGWIEVEVAPTPGEGQKWCGGIPRMGGQTCVPQRTRHGLQLEPV
jgi:hypothetical protein